MARGKASAETQAPVLVVSNRLPVTATRARGGLTLKASAGGLVSAMEPVLKRYGGTWVGWLGTDLKAKEKLPKVDVPYKIGHVPLSEADVQRYYHGFSNRTLWPLFHSFPELAQFERREWDAYERVNARFAEAAVEHGADHAVMWVHDYHLMRAPRYIRPHLAGGRLAFFLHIPFPPYDLFRLLPWSRKILRGMLSCDLIGFHVHGYARNFMDCVEFLLGERVDRRAMLVEHGDRTVQIGVHPLGIDFDLFESRAHVAPPAAKGDERVILGVDRLDYTKGIPERLAAFERLLDRFPQHRERVVLVQLAVPSRSQVTEYRDLKRELDELVGRINGRFGTATWTPIRYMYRAVPPERLCAMYRDAQVGLVTPVRDGMNLVAKEYVACQTNNPGVLVLSRLAGAAETMREAIQVNPYDVDGTAESLHRALSMDDSERSSRMTALRRRERRDNVHEWVRRFLDAARATQDRLRPPTPADFDAWLGRRLANYHIALFLDYDGTLTPLCEHPSKALLSDAMRRGVEACAARDDTDVTIVSGRGLADIRKVVGMEALTYAGNHGLEIHGKGIPDFRHDDVEHFLRKTTELGESLSEIGVAGAWAEVKGPTLTFHFREVESDLQARVAAQASAIITSAGFQARSAHAAIEARPPIGWDKGRAVLHILKSRHGLSWAERVRPIYVGDDQTDEDAFRVLSGLGATFRVGSADTATAADRRLRDVESVRALLEYLSTRVPTAP